MKDDFFIVTTRSWRKPCCHKPLPPPNFWPLDSHPGVSVPQTNCLCHLGGRPHWLTKHLGGRHPACFCFLGGHPGLLPLYWMALSNSSLQVLPTWRWRTQIDLSGPCWNQEADLVWRYSKLTKIFGDVWRFRVWVLCTIHYYHYVEDDWGFTWTEGSR